MLKSFLKLQQRELDALGEERTHLRQQLQKEELRREQLRHLASSLQRPEGETLSLHWQNRSGMSQQIRKLEAHQQQQVALAQSDLARNESFLLRQFGKVKGLEQVVAQRVHEQQEAARKNEQKQSDELAIQGFLRQEKTGGNRES